jgi:hypothetical protein
MCMLTISPFDVIYCFPNLPPPPPLRVPATAREGGGGGEGRGGPSWPYNLQPIPFKVFSSRMVPSPNSEPGTV